MKRTTLITLPLLAVFASAAPAAPGSFGPAAGKVPNRHLAARAADTAATLDLAALSEPKRIARRASGSFRAVRHNTLDAGALERAEFARLEVADDADRRTPRRVSSKVPNRFRHFD